MQYPCFHVLFIIWGNLVKFMTWHGPQTRNLVAARSKCYLMLGIYQNSVGWWKIMIWCDLIILSYGFSNNRLISVRYASFYEWNLLIIKVNFLMISDWLLIWFNNSKQENIQNWHATCGKPLPRGQKPQQQSWHPKLH